MVHRKYTVDTGSRDEQGQGLSAAGRVSELRAGLFWSGAVPCPAVPVLDVYLQLIPNELAAGSSEVRRKDGGEKGDRPGLKISRRTTADLGF